MLELRINEIAEILESPLYGGDAELLCRGVSTDTRTLCFGSLFLALRGKCFDGHAFLPEAVARGAHAAVVDSLAPLPQFPQIVVRNTLEALGRLAAFHRRKCCIPVVAVAGSVGKTSTREMIRTVVSPHFNVHATTKNFNNEIGVPQVLLELDRFHELAVVEMGMRGLGELRYLGEMAAPTVAVITNIGTAHFGYLGSRDAIASAKAEILQSLPASGTAILNRDSDYFNFLKDQCTAHVITYGFARESDLCITDFQVSAHGEPQFKINGHNVSIPYIGCHHAMNAAAACAVAVSLKISLTQATNALSHFRVIKMHMEMVQGTKGLLVINDAFNASPESMYNAIDTLAAVGSSLRRRRVAVLGDMTGLGQLSEVAHRQVAAKVESAGIEVLVTIGKEAENITVSSGFCARHHFPTVDEAVKDISLVVNNDDLVLVKASHSLKIERIVTALTGRVDVGRDAFYAS
jgi:UDP-N-acetylmuramoyl-tripeptide--D-alanyl-D-alanine ligase